MDVEGLDQNVRVKVEEQPEQVLSDNSDHLTPNLINELKKVTTTHEVMKWLKILKNSVESNQSMKEGHIITATLGIPWANDSSTSDMFIEYLSDLLSFYPHHISLVLHSLLSSAINPCTDESIHIHINTHSAIKTLLYLVPKCSLFLMKILESLAPYKAKPSQYQESFIRCCLYIASYYNNLHCDMLQLVILKMLQTDVEVVVTDDNGSNDEPCQLSMDVDCKCQAKLYLALRYSDHGNMVDSMAENMDVMMMVMFEYLEHTKDSIVLFQLLLRTFLDQIILTHNSCYVQFLIFKMTSYDPEYAMHFLDMLWNKFQDMNISNVVRQSCSLYMASYLVRANFVSINVLKVCLDLMCQWLHDYLNEVDDTDGVIKVGMLYHPAFYYLCQTVFYIFNFHHKTLLDADRNFILQLNFERIISSKLNPLKMCKTSIVNQFASITSKYEIIFCYTIIEANKRLFLPLFLTEANYGSPEMLFPYEPYNLKRSGQHINHLYLHHHSEESEDINKETPPQTHDQAPSSDSTTNS